MMEGLELTVDEWFGRIEDIELQTKLLINLEDVPTRSYRNHPRTRYPSLNQALHCSFVYGQTPEGFNHWANIEDDMRFNPERYLISDYLEPISKNYNI